MVEGMEIRDNALHRAFGLTKPPGTAGRMVARYSGNCTSPVRLIKDKQMDQEMHVRCRNCPGCLRARQHLWRMRAEWETMNARTWFFTGTWAKQHNDIDIWNRECTLWLKRCRKKAARNNVRLRYLIMPEKHKSGMLHMHALVHQLSWNVEDSLSYRDLTSSWRAGFKDCKLADWRTAGYITKYATKDLLTKEKLRPRIRCSNGYGAAVMERDQDKLVEILRDRPPIKDTDVWVTNLKQALRETRCNQRPATPTEIMMMYSHQYSQERMM